jgi:hypothetical protein
MQSVQQYIGHNKAGTPRGTRIDRIVRRISPHAAGLTSFDKRSVRRKTLSGKNRSKFLGFLADSLIASPLHASLTNPSSSRLVLLCQLY